MAAFVESATCIGCTACVGTCPVNAISMVEGKALVDEATCISCTACVGACPVSAISMK